MLSDVYFPRINGVSTSIQTFRRQFTALGHEVLLIAPAYELETVAERGIVRLPARTVPFDPEDRMMGFKAALELEPVLRERRFDLIHIQTPFVAHYAGVALSDRLSLPRLETYHTFFEEYLHHYVPLVPSSWMRALARRFSRAQCNDLDAVVVPSRAMRAVLKEYGVQTPIEIIPTGLELERLREGDGAAFRQRHHIAPGRPVLVHVGRVAFEKNIDFLLRMLVRVRTEVPDVLLVIAGEGPSRKHLQALALRLGLERNVLFLGYLDRRNALLDCYRAGDAFVFASHTETQGLVLLEAMALGVPVVSTAVMGTSDILEPGRGALVARADETQFAARVIELLRDAELRVRLSQDAREYALEWSAPRLAARMLELYDRVLGAGPGATSSDAKLGQRQGCFDTILRSSRRRRVRLVTRP
jgi:glycosyltransferase involved in cell wall biosynthesis